MKPSWSSPWLKLSFFSFFKRTLLPKVNNNNVKGKFLIMEIQQTEDIFSTLHTNLRAWLNILGLRTKTSTDILWLGLQQGQASLLEIAQIQCELTFLGLYTFLCHTTILCTVTCHVIIKERHCLSVTSVESLAYVLCSGTFIFKFQYR